MGPQSAVLGLQVDGVDPTLDESVTDIVQAGQGLGGVGGGSVGESSTGPEDLGDGGGSGPDDGVEVLRAGLLSPEEGLTTEDEVGLGSGDVCEGVEDVGLAKR